MAVRGDEGGRLSRALGASRSVHLTSVCTGAREDSAVQRLSERV